MGLFTTLRAAIARSLGGHAWEPQPSTEAPAHQPAPAAAAAGDQAAGETIPLVQQPAPQGRGASLLGAWLDGLTMAPAAEAPRLEWRTLPGQRLELVPSGYQIHLERAGGEVLYRLYTPEGQSAGWTCNGLQDLKRYGEQLARDRAEFEVRR